MHLLEDGTNRSRWNEFVDRGTENSCAAQACRRAAAVEVRWRQVGAPQALSQHPDEIKIGIVGTLGFLAQKREPGFERNEGQWRGQQRDEVSKTQRLGMHEMEGFAKR